ncbi:hypothetical protein CJ030_MR8G022199 [Morella rubra]|uniref:Uncharacterized protein n=1 Tax=Morella rubra TaxID=262757 RepID=A0A6A1UR84_9ROSI|nr:hypothetical protein CJ030_MR8G022199 [Morella rubra]
MKQKVDKSPPFTLEIMMHRVESPVNRLEGYRSQMDLLDTQYAIKWKVFFTTLPG